MRFWLNAALVASILLPSPSRGHTTRANALGTPTQVLADVPKCAASCLTTAVSKSSCSLSDMQCICDTKSINDEASQCILHSCSLSDALVAKNVTSIACNAPFRDKSGQYSAMAISLGSIAVFLVLARVIFKRFFSARRSLAPEDTVILGTLALRVSCIIINVRGLAHHGLGRDVWTLPLEELSTFGMYLYIMEVLYFVELSLIKISLSLFYMGIFPGTNIRRLLLGTTIFNGIFGLAFALAGIFQCQPVSYFWTQYTDPRGGSCINLNAFGWVNGALSVAVDLWLIAIPLSQVSKLTLHWKKKMGVIIMFIMGTFVTVVSILRLQSLVFFANSTNPTYDQWSPVNWSTVEVNVGMICTCLPSLRLILVRIFPRLGSGSKGGRSHGSDSSHSQPKLSDSRVTKEQHHLSDLESGKVHQWHRIETESIS
ncbi:hypothetical protein JDV02_007663 [Purpureocillium takamizusanense]|uniref:CFEM domain-containing protein n=1 Tax=Purpureocillium takamizusanense TaxID=2060973 RepID=A0A9Q8VCJ1_9HYPO|nr:uncharacterized protein JDV02_007663 [Purpureocillium takamizusanense]UNI21695.1 hypothetical protein JDV02_007663 [Purpureocillium takamizusanense]